MKQRVGLRFAFSNSSTSSRHTAPCPLVALSAKSWEEPAIADHSRVKGRSHISSPVSLGCPDSLPGSWEASGSGCIARHSSSSVPEIPVPGPMHSAVIRPAELLSFRASEILKGIRKGKQQREGESKCVTSRRCPEVHKFLLFLTQPLGNTTHISHEPHLHPAAHVKHDQIRMGRKRREKDTLWPGPRH